MQPAGKLSVGSFIRGLFLSADRRLNLFWRLVIYMFSFFVIFILSIIPAALLALAFNWPQQVINMLSGLISIPAMIAWTYFYRRSVDKRSWRGIRMPAVWSALPQLGLGFLTASALVGVVLLLEYIFGWTRITDTQIATSGLLSALGSSLLVLIANAAAGFDEEVYYRGYVFQNLGTFFPLWLTVPISAILFTLVVHFNNLTLEFIIYATLAGVMLALFRLLTGSIWFSIGLHWSWDWSLNSLFGLDKANTRSDALLHLTRNDPVLTLGPISFTGDRLIQFSVLALTILALILWLHYRKRVSWQSKLDDDGEPVALKEKEAALG